MKKFDNDKVTTYRCKRCHKPIRVPESILRGMGPICFGKSYTIRGLLKRGLTKEEIENISKEEMKKLIKEAVRRYNRKQKRKQQRNQNMKIPKTKIRKFKKDNQQKTLLPFISIIKETNELEKLKEELSEVITRLPKTSGSDQMILSDKSFILMEKIKNLEAL